MGRDGESEVPFVEDVHSPKEMNAYLSALRDGAEEDIAARSIRSTATRMRRFTNRDPEWKALVEDAILRGKETYRDRLRGTIRARATALTGGSDRLLEVELATHVPGYEHLRRDRVRHEGNVDVSFRFPVEAISDLTKEEALAVKRALAKMRGDVVDGDARELGPGE